VRSRYSAWALGLFDYLRESHHRSTRVEREFDPSLVWESLSIESTEAGGPSDDEGWVVFTATGHNPEGRFDKHERSHFLRDGVHWRYNGGVPL